MWMMLKLDRSDCEIVRFYHSDGSYLRENERLIDDCRKNVGQVLMWILRYGGPSLTTDTMRISEECKGFSMLTIIHVLL